MKAFVLILAGDVDEFMEGKMFTEATIIKTLTEKDVEDMVKNDEFDAGDVLMEIEIKKIKRWELEPKLRTIKESDL